MATRNTASKPDDPKPDDPKPEASTSEPAPEQATTARDTTASGGERTVVPPSQGQEHGYIGSVHSDKDRDALTVAGVTGGTANVADTPKSVTREGTEAVS